MNRTLYHFPFSPFSRRTRLALASKGLSAALVDGRAEPARFEEARRSCPVKTVPILVEPDGRAIGDSTAITRYLDLAYPEVPRFWPEEPGAARVAIETATLVDIVLNTVVDVGTRYFALRDAPAWESVKGEMLGRATAALDALAARAAERDGKTWTDAGWCAADAWVFTATQWIGGWQARAGTNPLLGQLLSLGVSVPPALARWADAHRDRPDVQAL